MPGHRDIGLQGEEQASLFLQGRGYRILHRNWRHLRYEIDIIAEKNGVLHIVEVKLRSSNAFGYPEAAVNRSKFQRLLAAADAFLYLHPEYRHVQYDIVSINTFPGKEPEFFLIEDVYL